MRARKPWYSQEQRVPALFVCTYMGRGQSEGRPFRFFLNLSNAIAANVYLLLYPSKQLARLVKEKPELLRSLLDFLNNLQPEEMKTEGRVYGGGLHKIEPKELGRLSITHLVGAIPELRGLVKQDVQLTFEGLLEI